MGNPVLAGGSAADTGAFSGMMRPNTRGAAGHEYDAVSQASSAYVGKRATTSGGGKRQMSAQSRTIKLTPGAKAYYPNGYYKRVGYQKSEASSNARVDALGQRVRDRFNEDSISEYEHGRAAGGGLQTRTLKQLKQAHTANKGGPASQVSRQSDVFTKNKMAQQRKVVAAAKEELDA